jgi:hypothetical protein
MLVEMKKLVIENTGYKRSVSLSSTFINTDKIIEISDYFGAHDFLLTEGSALSKEKFSLLKIDLGSSTEEIIVLGDAKGLFEKCSQSDSPDRVLYG